MSLADLAKKYSGLSTNLHREGVYAGAQHGLHVLEELLAQHRRTGKAADTLQVLVTSTGVVVESVDYRYWIKGVPQLLGVKSIVKEGYNARVRALLQAGA